MGISIKFNTQSKNYFFLFITLKNAEKDVVFKHTCVSLYKNHIILDVIVVYC